jgi:hypothetical protein
VVKGEADEIMHSSCVNYFGSEATSDRTRRSSLEHLTSRSLR